MIATVHLPCFFLFLYLPRCYRIHLRSWCVSFLFYPLAGNSQEGWIPKELLHSNRCGIIFKSHITPLSLSLILSPVVLLGSGRNDGATGERERRDKTRCLCRPRVNCCAVGPPHRFFCWKERKRCPLATLHAFAQPNLATGCITLITLLLLSFSLSQSIRYSVHLIRVLVPVIYGALIQSKDTIPLAN